VLASFRRGGLGHIGDSTHFPGVVDFHELAQLLR
jgi:hypothetical protein